MSSEFNAKARRGGAATKSFWTAAGSEAPRRFGSFVRSRKAVSPLRSVTAVQILVDQPTRSSALPGCRLFRLEHDGAQGRQTKFSGMLLVVAGNVFGGEIGRAHV